MSSSTDKTAKQKARDRRKRKERKAKHKERAKLAETADWWLGDAADVIRGEHKRKREKGSIDWNKHMTWENLGT